MGHVEIMGPSLLYFTNTESTVVENLLLNQVFVVQTRDYDNQIGIGNPNPGKLASNDLLEMA